MGQSGIGAGGTGEWLVEEAESLGDDLPVMATAAPCHQAFPNVVERPELSRSGLRWRVRRDIRPNMPQTP